MCLTSHLVIFMFSLYLLCNNLHAIFSSNWWDQVNPYSSSVRNPNHEFLLLSQYALPLPLRKWRQSICNQNGTKQRSRISSCCFCNVSCYATSFKNKQGLCQHLCRSNTYRDYMSEARPLVAASVGIVQTKSRYSTAQALGIWRWISTPNSFSECRSPASYNPYNIFDYSDHFDADNGINIRLELKW